MKKKLFLSKKSFEELLEHLGGIVQEDRKELENRSLQLVRLQKDNDPNVQDFEAKLQRLHLRLEVMEELLQRCKDFYISSFFQGIHTAKQEAIRKGTPNAFGLHIQFSNNYPKILIL